MGTGGTSMVLPPLPDGGPIEFKLDCGASGIAVEGHGPPENRVNYVIVGDCYTQADIDGGLYLAHVKKMIDDPDAQTVGGGSLSRSAGAVPALPKLRQHLRAQDAEHRFGMRNRGRRTPRSMGTATRRRALATSTTPR